MIQVKRYISLFAGIGGFELGIQQALPEAQCVFASEVDKYAQQTYRANHSSPLHGDITQIPAEDIRKSR